MVENDFRPSDLFTLDQTGKDLFIARRSEPNPYGILFGGQLLGQSVAAACSTVEIKKLHSIHVNFIKTGFPGPVTYSVERLRDGAQLETRQVRGFQNDRVLINLTASFRVTLDSFNHQRKQTETLNVKDAIDLGCLSADMDAALSALPNKFTSPSPLQMRIPRTDAFLTTSPEPRRNYWIKASDAEGLAYHGQQTYFAYLSDLMLAGAALVPHVVPLPGPHLRSVSLDHVIWFHRPINCAQWILFETEGPNAANGFNLSQAWAYDQDGALVATILQESLQMPK